MILDLTNLSIIQIKTLNSIWSQSLKDFNNISEQILSATNTNLNMLLHPAVSRNPYQSDIYINIIYTYFAIEEFKSRKNLRTIITQNNTQKKLLKQHFRSLGINSISLQAAGGKKTLFSSNLKALLKILYKIQMYIAAKDTKRIPKTLINNKITLLDTFILKNSLEQDKYIDRYYPGLLNFVSTESAEAIYWIPSILSKFSKRKLNKIKQNSTENLLFKHDFLSWSDYIKILMQLFKKTKVVKQEFYFSDLNVSSLVYQEIKSNVMSTTSFEGMINYYFIKNLKKLNVELNMVIDWNENQPIDKGLIKGVHDFYPRVKVKGYQGYIISTDYNFYIQPTDYEIGNGVIPDEICVVGDALQERIKKFSNKIKVSTAPAFRFKDVYVDYEIEKKSSNVEIIVALPIGYEESFSIIKLLIQCKDDFVRREYSIKIKPHPVLNINKLKNDLQNDWPINFKIVDGDFNKLLAQSHLLIGSTSTTLVESLSRGIPVVVIGNLSGITQNPIPHNINEDMWRLCYTKEELTQSIVTLISYRQQNQPELLNVSYKIKIDFFKEATQNLVKQFISNN